MSKKPAPTHALSPEHRSTPEPSDSVPHHDVSSPEFVHDNDRMKLASKPNDGQPLSHRDRGKAGRKG